MTHQFIKDRDIILFGLQSWNSEIAFNLKEMAFELARYNRVLFVDRARDRNSMLKTIFSRSGRQVEQPGNPLEKIGENIWVLHTRSLLESGNWSPNYRIFDFFNRINNKRLAAEIKQSVRALNFTQCILINDNDFFRGLYLKSLLPIRDYIFYIRDSLTSQPYFRKYGPRCEVEMIQRSDLIVANSAWLADYAGQWNPNSVDIGQGCHPEAFLKEDLSVPTDMLSIPEPVVGYCGAVHSLRLDEELLYDISNSLPEINFVFVGPVDSQFAKSKLRQQANIFFLGSKPFDQVAAYIKKFRICINPQLVNALTIGNYPRKIDEYLASGKPVVAIRTPAMELFGDYVTLCDNKEQFVSAIEKRIRDNESEHEEEKERRRAFALTHTWENSMGALGDAFHQQKKK